MSKKYKWLGVTVLIGFLALAFAASMGAFDNRHYYEVPHGSHTHYVAKDKDPNLSVSDFPTRPPREGERISSTGQFVPAGSATDN